MYASTFIVEADSEEEAKTSTDVVEEEGDTDSWGYEIVSVTLIEEDEEDDDGED